MISDDAQVVRSQCMHCSEMENIVQHQSPMRLVMKIQLLEGFSHPCRSVVPLDLLLQSGNKNGHGNGKQTNQHF
ncbi:hypothetical protein T09_14275 [Trichinella sp. T9]|nr:hypothetical protein T09_14275 [Trichinella sp. T9]